MNDIVKGVLIFVSGAALGGGTAYILTKNVLEERKAKEISDKVQDALSQYKSHEMAKLNNDIKEEIKDKIFTENNLKSKFDPIREEYRKSIAQYIPVEEPKEAPDDENDDILEKHNAFEDSANLSEDDILKEEEDDVDVEKGKNGSPYLISPEEYQNDHTDDYEKESLILFKDNILTDQDFAEISVDDANKLLGGGKLFTAFGSKGAKKNRVYIRNDLLHTDYEIVKSPRKYTQEVLRMEDQEEE